jgi:photosystem II stability/assembly factor-like uncharacterized protein
MIEEDARHSIHAAFSRAYRPPMPGFKARMQTALQSTDASVQSTRGSSADHKLAARYLRPSSYQWVVGVVSALLAVAVVASLVYIRLGAAPQSPGAIPQSPSIEIPVQGSQATDAGWVTDTTVWRDDGDGHLLHSTDSGWKDVTPAGLTALNDYYIDATHAWIVASPSSLAAGLIGGPTAPPIGPLQLLTIRTMDGGLTWQQGMTVASFSYGWTQLLKYGHFADIDLYFLNYAQGWLLVPNETSRTLYTTNDGGLHWKVAAVDSVGHPTPCRWSRMEFVSASTGWMTNNCVDPLATESTSLLVSHDGGVTWRPQALPVVTATTCQQLKSSCFRDCPPTFGLRAAWVTDSYWPGCVSPPLFFDTVHGALLVWSMSGSQLQQKLLETADGGTTWSVRSLPGQVQLQVEFIDANHGWAIAGLSNQFTVLTDSYGRASFVGKPLALPLYRTDDSGMTWVPVHSSLLLQSAEYGQFYGMHFVDLSHGFAYFDRGQQLRTTDGGRSWSVAG